MKGIWVVLHFLCCHVSAAPCSASFSPASSSSSCSPPLAPPALTAPVWHHHHHHHSDRPLLSSKRGSAKRTKEKAKANRWKQAFSEREEKNKQKMKEKKRWYQHLTGDP